MDKKKLVRYVFSLLMIALMTGVAEWTEEKEIIFPEMVALTIGLWIIDKRVWNVNRLQIILLMTVGSIAGVCIVRYSPCPFLCNIGIAYAFAAICLFLTRTGLIPLISACILPVLLQTETWIYPSAVFLMSVLAVTGQKLMEKYGIRHRTEYVPIARNWKRDLLRWFCLLFFVVLISTLAVGTRNLYFIIPPLLVTFTEIVNSKAGFRNRPVQVFLFMVTSSALGTIAQLVGYYQLHLPESVVTLFILICLFILFEWTGKYFAPAGALALIPLLIPQEKLFWLPLQAAIGAAIFIAIAMVVFLRCYQWSRGQLIYCFTPTLLRRYLKQRKNN